MHFSQTEPCVPRQTLPFNLCSGRLFLASSPDVLPLAVDALNQGDAIFILGYSGWSEGQLESEMAANSWINVPWDADCLLYTSDAADE